MFTENKGFTLVEVLVAVVILGIIAMGMVGMIRNSQNEYTLNKNINIELENANSAMWLMIRELRQAKPQTPPSMSITCSNTAISFYDSSNKSIQYKLDTTSKKLTRIYNNGTPEILAEYVDNTDLFSYSNNVVTIHLVINNNGIKVDLQDSVRPRNF